MVLSAHAESGATALPLLLMQVTERVCVPAHEHAENWGAFQL